MKLWKEMEGHLIEIVGCWRRGGCISWAWGQHHLCCSRRACAKMGFVAWVGSGEKRIACTGWF